MTFFICGYILLRFLSQEYFVFVKEEKKSLKKEKKQYEYAVEDDKSTLRQADNAEKLNKNFEPLNNHPYKDLKESYPEYFKDDSIASENKKKLKDHLEEEIAKNQEEISQIERQMNNVTPTPSDSSDSASTPTNSISEDFDLPTTSKKRKTPSDFIDELPSELPSFIDNDD
jgi:hypothetical protein